MTSFTDLARTWAESLGVAKPRNDGPDLGVTDMEAVRVLIADPAGNVEGGAEVLDLLMGNMLKAFENRPGMVAERGGKPLAMGEGESLADRLSGAMESGRSRMREKKADLLIWGEILADGSGVRWRFMPAKDAPFAALGMPGPADSLMVPPELEEVTADAFYAMSLAAIVPANANQEARLTQALMDILETLSRLPVGIPRGMQRPFQHSLLKGVALAVSRLAARSNGPGWFQEAEKLFMAAEKAVPRDMNELQKAIDKTHVARLYAALAQLESPTAHRTRALKLFDETLKSFTRESFPIEWANAKLAIADIYRRMGADGADPEHLKTAARHYRLASEVYTQADHPRRWGELMNALGRILMQFGEAEPAGDGLEQAGIAFQSALKVVSKEQTPLQWASIQNNLGATLFALAKRNPDTIEWVIHSRACFEGALTVYKERSDYRLIHVIEKNIAKVQQMENERGIVHE